MVVLRHPASCHHFGHRCYKPRQFDLLVTKVTIFTIHSHFCLTDFLSPTLNPMVSISHPKAAFSIHVLLLESFNTSVLIQERFCNPFSTSVNQCLNVLSKPRNQYFYIILFTDPKLGKQIFQGWSESLEQFWAKYNFIVISEMEKTKLVFRGRISRRDLLIKLSMKLQWWCGFYFMWDCIW